MENDKSKPGEDHDHLDDEPDDCLCDINLFADEVTEDSALPAAEGGVASDED